MAVFAKDFTFDGVTLSSKSSSYALVSFDGVEDSSTIFSRSVKRSDITYNSVITHDYGAIDSDVMKFSITICKACADMGESFTQAETRDIIGWLTSPTEPKHLFFTGRTGKEMYTGLHFFGRFVSGEYAQHSADDKDGIKLSFENISPYAFTDEYVYTIKSYSDSNGVLSIENVGTKTGKIIAPYITITPHLTETITINNASDTSMDAFSIKVTKDTPVIISDYNIYDSNGNLYDLANCNNLYFPVMMDGTNLFSITGYCDIEIKVRYFENIGI